MFKKLVTCFITLNMWKSLIYNNFFEFFIKSNLISSNQSGFKQGDSCIHQFLSITHEIYQQFDNGVGIGGIFLGPLLCLIYTNNLFGNLSSDPKLFPDDTFLFSIVHDINQSGINLNDDLEKLSKWAFQQKMSFNLDINKQAQVIFSHKLQKSDHPSIKAHSQV